MIVHLIDGTYELFRHFYGQRSFNKGKDKPLGAVGGVLHSVLEIIEAGGTYVGVATDHVIESFRNGLWPDYKTGEGIDPVLHAQFHPLEDALAAMGVAVWPMIDLYGPIESFPPEALGAAREHAILFKSLATLRTDAVLFADVDELRWEGPSPAFEDWAARIDPKRLLARAMKAGEGRRRPTRSS